MKRHPVSWLSLLKDYWWLAGILGGGILLWGNLPERVKKVEAGQANQQEELGAIRDATKEIQGYLKGQQALNERLAAQQQAPATQVPFRSPPAPVGHPGASGGYPSGDVLPEEVSDDGEVKVFRFEGRTLCCNGTECWAWQPKTKCAHSHE